MFLCEKRWIDFCYIFYFGITTIKILRLSFSLPLIFTNIRSANFRICLNFPFFFPLTINHQFFAYFLGVLRNLYTSPRVCSVDLTRLTSFSARMTSWLSLAPQRSSCSKSIFVFRCNNISSMGVYSDKQNELLGVKPSNSFCLALYDPESQNHEVWLSQADIWSWFYLEQTRFRRKESQGARWFSMTEIRSRNHLRWLLARVIASEQNGIPRSISCWLEVEMGLSRSVLSRILFKYLI